MHINVLNVSSFSQLSEHYLVLIIHLETPCMKKWLSGFGFSHGKHLSKLSHPPFSIPDYRAERVHTAVAI